MFDMCHIWAIYLHFVEIGKTDVCMQHSGVARGGARGANAPPPKFS